MTQVASEKIVDFLKKSAISSVDVTDDEEKELDMAVVTKEKKPVKVLRCDFCGEIKNRKSALVMHERYCKSNPDRQTASHVGKTECWKCGVIIGKQGIKNHLAWCNGDTDRTLKRKERVRALAEKKGFRRISGSEVRTHPSANRITGKGGAKPKAARDLDAFIQIIEDRVQGSDVSFREFNDWKALTTKIWDKTS